MTATQEAPTLSARDAALADVERWAAKVVELEGRRDDCARELTALRSTSGRDLLDDSDGGLLTRVSARIPELESTLGLLEKAIAEAVACQLTARRDALRAEAAELDGPIEEARALLCDHDDKTARLLGALEQHAGVKFRPETPELLLEEAEGRGAFGVRMVWQRPRLELLQDEVSRLETRRDALLAAAHGQPVTLGWDELPDSLRPGGVLPLPGARPPVDELQAATEFLVIARRERDRQQAVMDRIAMGLADREDMLAHDWAASADLPLERGRLNRAIEKFYSAEAALERAQANAAR